MVFDMSGSPLDSPPGLMVRAVMIVDYFSSVVLWLIPWAMVAALGLCFLRVLRFFSNRGLGLTNGDSCRPPNTPGWFDEMANIAISRRPRKRKHRHRHHHAASVPRPKI